MKVMDTMVVLVVMIGSGNGGTVNKGINNVCGRVMIQKRTKFS